MSEKHQEMTRASGIATRRALHLFEEALDILDEYRVDQAEPGVPALPLGGLLDQCEALLDTLHDPEMMTIVAPAGTLPADSDWWRERFPGIEPVFSPPGSGTRNATAQAQTDWARAATRRGRTAVRLVDPGHVGSPPDGPIVLALCHPYRAYRAAARQGETLTHFCRRLRGDLAALDGMPRVKLDGAEAPFALLALALGLTPAPELDEQRLPPAEAIPPLFEGAADYEALCAFLGYDPASLPASPPPPTASPPRAAIPSGRGAAAISFVSGFAARVVSVHKAFHPSAPAYAIAPLVELLDASVGVGDAGFLETFDRGLEQFAPEDAAIACLAAAAHFRNVGNHLHTLSFVGEGMERAPLNATWINVLAASLYAEAGAPRLALSTLVEPALQPGMLEPAGHAALVAACAAATPASKAEHGHALLIDYLAANPPLPLDRQRNMTEIGTTRETVPGQGSTRKLARLCADTGIAFTTIDMDPRNTRNALRLFARLSLPFQALCEKGEDYLTRVEGPLDYVFLDAYDFDHGNHSDLRQNRYETYLGAPIDDAQCHQMHLDCAISLVVKLAPDGLLCFDDTWKDADGNWTAKGKTAMPFLLANGFEVIVEQNRAALLRRRA